jgi:hypothetical protein
MDGVQNAASAETDPRRTLRSRDSAWTSERQRAIRMALAPSRVTVGAEANRAHFPTATAQIMSNEMIQSEIVDPRWAPSQCAEYTVGVSGCEKRATYLVVCAESGTGCVAAGAQNQIQK